MVFPQKGYYQPKHKEMILEAPVFEGYVAEADRLRLAILPSDHSLFHDHPFVLYSRSFNGPPETWVGL